MLICLIKIFYLIRLRNFNLKNDKLIWNFILVIFRLNYFIKETNKSLTKSHKKGKKF